MMRRVCQTAYHWQRQENSYRVVEREGVEEEIGGVGADLRVGHCGEGKRSDKHEKRLSQ